MFSISVINDGKVVKLTCNSKPVAGKQQYELRSMSDAFKVDIKFDKVGGGLWADVWQVTNEIRRVASWPEATIVAAMANGFNFYEMGTSKIRPMDSEVRFSLETSDLED